MAELNCQFVRPDRLLFDGPVANLVLVTYAGELGVWPGHAPEIVALGDGVVRMRTRQEDGGEEYDVVVSGGYAEIDNDGVIILADHARRTDDIDPEVVRRTRDEAIEALDEIAAGDEDTVVALYNGNDDTLGQMQLGDALVHPGIPGCEVDPDKVYVGLLSVFRNALDAGILVYKTCGYDTGWYSHHADTEECNKDAE